ncbi:MAG: ROK family protein [Renibacterium sp.]|nr:ROK family protein [Renibacterium sp.]
MSSERLAGGSLAGLRQINVKETLRALRQLRGQSTLAELAQQTGLSRPTLRASLAELEVQGWVSVTEAAPGQMGRPARRFGFRSASNLVLGVDLGPHKIDLRFTDLNGECVHQQRAEVPAGLEVSPAMLVELIQNALDAIPAPASLWYVVVGFPGVVADSGMVIRSFVLPDWTSRPANEELAELLGVPVALENDANLAAYAESTIGAGRGANSLVYFMVGTRVSVGVVIHGRVYRGAHGAAGEVGLYPEAAWPDPRKRLLSQVADQPGLDEAAAIAGVFTAAERGDPVARAAVAEFCELLSLPLAAVVLTLDPDAVVIGGGMARLGARLLDPLRAALGEAIWHRVELRLADYADDSVVRGAVGKALQSVDEQILGL